MRSGSIVWHLFAVAASLVTGVLASSGGAAAGVLSGAAVFAASAILLWLTQSAAPVRVFGAAAGFAVFAAVAKLTLPLTANAWPNAPSLAYLAVLSIAGMICGARAADALPGAQPRAGSHERANLIDSSALIDGRIVEMAEMGYLRGGIIIPRFVLRELQMVADSSDPTRRARGRRGLASAEKLQSIAGDLVSISEKDFTSLGDVDSKLVAYARAENAAVVTTDFNLAQVAKLQGVEVLNVHELSKALRPLLMPGEHLTLTLQKDGREEGQGVGFLEDGTMVVVENGQRLIGQTVETVVTSVLQTAGGRMIFSRIGDEAEEPAEMREKRRAARVRS